MFESILAGLLEGAYAMMGYTIAWIVIEFIINPWQKKNT
jgi:hypothetical protein